MQLLFTFCSIFHSHDMVGLLVVEALLIVPVRIHVIASLCRECLYFGDICRCGDMHIEFTVIVKLEYYHGK